MANLIDYISTGEVTDDYTRQLDEEVQELRNDTGKGVSYMTYMQNIMENRAMAYEEGVEKVAAAMLKNNIPSEMVAKCTDLTLEQVI